MKKINTEQTKVNKTPTAESMNHLTEENLNILLKAMKIGFYKDFHRKGLLDKEGLKEQTEFYDSEIKRLSEEISNHKDEETVYNEQIESLNEAIKQIQFITDSDTDNTELYRSMIEKIIVPEYQRLDIYLKGLPFAFNIKYTTLKAPCKGIYEIIIDYCEMSG